MASTTKGLDRLLRQIGSIDQAIIAEAAAALGANSQQLARAIAAAAPKHTGDMAAGIQAKAVETTRGGGASVKGARGLARKVSAPFPAMFVEFGTKASAGQGPQPNRNFKRTSGVMTKAKRAHAATRAQPFFWPTIRAFKKLMRGRIVRASNKAAKRIAASR